MHNIEDELYSVALDQKMAPQLNYQRNQLQLFHIIISGFSIENLQGFGKKKLVAEGSFLILCCQ